MSYIGKKPVDFNDVTEAQTLTVTGDLTVDTDTLFVDASADAVGINKSAPAMGMDIVAANNSQLRIDSSDANDTTFFMDYNGGGATNRIRVRNAAGDLAFNVSNTSEVMRIDSSGNVGIGTSSPEEVFHVYHPTANINAVIESGDANAYLAFKDNSTTGYAHVFLGASGNNMTFFSGGSSERMRIDSSGNLLVGTTDLTQFNNSGASADTGVVVAGTSYIDVSRVSNPMLYLNRCSTDGQIVSFSKDGTGVGSIGTSGQVYIAGTSHALKFFSLGIQPANTSGANTDNSMDIGASSTRFDDIFATNGTIQTSDQNEKQQIASLTAAEITAAKAISKLFKTFKWNDSVETKGDAARTHAGVISQDVQSCMTNAGLDAGDYAFFISATWWETQTEVSAVEAVEAVDAVYDDDGNLVSEAVEAVEAQDAYTRIESYDTADEAPEGATERTRLGIRYPELLAFVGAATEQRLTHLETLEARIAALENA